MSFKTKDEYEKEKNRWQSYQLRSRSPAGYREFQAKEDAWKSSQKKSKKKSKSSNNKSKSSSNGMKISGDGSGYKGDTSKVDPNDLEFKGYNKVMTGKDIEDPGTKFAKKGNFKSALDRVEGKFYDKDGDLLIPKFDMPDRVKLTKKQKDANEAIDSQFDDNGFYNTEELKMPKLKQSKTKRSYRKAGNKLARRMGIDSDKINNGKKAMRAQSNRYNKKTGALNIPDFTIGSRSGQDMLKIGNKNLNTKGMRT